MTPLTKYSLAVLVATICALFMGSLGGPSVLTTEETLKRCMSSKDCRLLVEASYYESRNQSDKGVVAVMFVAINRATHPTKWPNTIREVVYQKRQFSYTHDGSLKKGFTEKEQYTRIALLAHSVLNGGIDSPIAQATHYHTKQISPPNWSKRLKNHGRIGEHIFYS